MPVNTRLYFDRIQRIEKEDEINKTLVFTNDDGFRLTIKGAEEYIDHMMHQLSARVGRTVFLGLSNLPPGQKQLGDQ